MARRKICVVTGSRAEYGLLFWIMKEIQNDPDLILQVVVTGMHLSPAYGNTYKCIEEDGFKIDARANIDLNSDTPEAITKSMGAGLIDFAGIFHKSSPDLVVVLGDRFEILVAATAAMMARIPIAHISGGEVTEGAIDDSIRHAITKMSSYHFVAAEPYRERVIRMGEEPARVLNFGDPGLDNIVRLKFMVRDELARDLNFELRRPTFLVTYHPATLSDIPPEHSTKALIDALDQFPEASIVFTKPNADTGGQVIAKMIDEYASTRRDRVTVVTSLGQRRYLSMMKYCDVVIGNSSSGIVEAPALKTATVNIGNRQKGRLRASSVIDCPEETGPIIEAIRTALSEPFRKKLPSTVSAYGNCDASRQIVRFLKTANIGTPKSFYDEPPKPTVALRVGGELEIRSSMFEADIVNSVPSFAKSHLLWVDSGRSAIRVALETILQRGGRLLAYLPTFCCESVIAPFESLGFEVRYYSMGGDLATPAALPVDLEGSTFLYIHYFGLRNDAVGQWLKDVRRKSQFFIIEDCVQAGLTLGIGQAGDFAVTSYRKFVPQMDGALLGSDDAIQCHLEDADEEFVSAKLVGKLLRADSDQDQLFISLLEESEQRLDLMNGSRKMSWLSKYLMQRTDFVKVANARRENWCILERHIQRADIGGLLQPLMRLRDGEVPLGYPVRILNGLRDDLRAYLKEHRVYCPVHWPIIGGRENSGMEADISLSRTILTLPIDQRLEEAELAYMVEKIAAFARLR